jgi:hypothetical protein
MKAFRLHLSLSLRWKFPKFLKSLRFSLSLSLRLTKPKEN